MNLAIVGTPGPSLPLSIRGHRQRVNEHVGKADPIWDTAFTTKFARKPKEDAPLVVPTGAAKVVHNFLSRVEELNYLIETQHYELATTRREMAANGLSALSLDALPADSEAADIAESHLRITPLDPDPVYAAAMTRRIEWEKQESLRGPVMKVLFATDRNGIVSIGYRGPDIGDEDKLAFRRYLKTRWLLEHSDLPTPEDLEDAKAFCDYYKKPVLARMSAEEYEAHHHSRRFAALEEDHDPFRTALINGDGRPNWEDYDTDNMEQSPDDPKKTIGQMEREQFAIDLAEWKATSIDVGYAGPSGILGIDDDQ